MVKILTKKKITIQIKKKQDFPFEVIPKKSTPYSVGRDLIAALKQEITISPYQRHIIPTGIYINLPQNYEAQIRSRSGLAINNGIIVLNSPGTIDNDYQGEVRVILVNLSKESFLLKPGMKIAQLVISHYKDFSFDIVKTFNNITTRNDKGFGSTGLY